MLKGLYGYSWVVGFPAGFLIYLIFVLLPPLARARASGAAALSTGAAGG